MQNIKIQYWLVVAVLVISTACEEFLEVEPKTQPLVEDVFSNAADIETLLLSAYQPMRWEYNLDYGDSYTFTYLYTDVRSDDVINENKFFQPHTHGFVIHPDNEVSLDASNICVEGVWAKFFAGIAAANEVIGGVLEVSDEVLSPETKNLFIAEARFLRAFYYFEAVKAFGDLPLFGDDPVDPANLESLRRRSVDDVYVQIESDLSEAAALLPETLTEDQFRATRGAALGILSKVFLYQEKWQQAAETAGALLALNRYELEENYADNFSIDNEFGKESIFEIHYEYSPLGGSFASSSASTLALQFFAPSMGDVSPGWNYNLVTPELRDAFDAEGDVIRRNATLIEEGTVFGSPAMQEAGQDPFPATGLVYINAEGDGGPRYGDDFVYSRKNFLTPEELAAHSAGGFQESPLNQKVLRLAEIYLIIAEASLNGGTTTEISGQDAFNLVRNRAGLADKALTYDALKLERRLELATEWNRFHDLIRWGDAATEIEGFVVGRDEYLPIPTNDINITGTDASGNLVLAQNPGY